MRARSVQLPADMWDYIEGKANSTYKSATAVLRDYIIFSARSELKDVVDSITAGTIQRLGNELIAELLTQTEVTLGREFKTKNEMANYFLKNPKLLEDVKRDLNSFFNGLNDTNLIKKLSGGGFTFQPPPPE